MYTRMYFQLNIQNNTTIISPQLLLNVKLYKLIYIKWQINEMKQGQHLKSQNGYNIEELLYSISVGTWYN